MSPESRQAQYLHARDVARLRELVAACPILVTYDTARRQFVARWLGGDDTRPEFAGRYQVVAAYLSGIRDAYLARA